MLTGRTPLAYFITFTTYGTWLPGDEREWVDRAQTEFGTERLAPDESRKNVAAARMRGPVRVLAREERDVVRRAIEETAATLGWTLHALNVRTNHVHMVVTSETQPELLMRKSKAWSTRRLRDRGLAAANQPIWTRHGSTRYLWDEQALLMASTYVVEGQGDPDWR